MDQKSSDKFRLRERALKQKMAKDLLNGKKRIERSDQPRNKKVTIAVAISG